MVNNITRCLSVSLLICLITSTSFTQNQSIINKKRTSITYFETIRTAQGIQLTWGTEDEGELDHFEISRSVDGKSYSTIQEVKPIPSARNGNTYVYNDLLADINQLETQRVHYKLSEVSIDGKVYILAKSSSSVNRSANRQPANIQDLLPQISPKSPNVSAMERYGNSPVNLYTGQPNIEIPIWDIKIGDMTIPIKLSYHPGGNKVLDIAPWTGMGWSLTGVYAITREQRGRPDLTSGLIIGGSLLDYPSPDISCLSEDLKEELNQHINFDKDLERDIFTYRRLCRRNDRA